MKTYELLNDASKLCRGIWAIGQDGKNYTNPRFFNGQCEAIKWDVDGALMCCYDDNVVYEATKDKLVDFIHKNFDTKEEKMELYKWNDTQTYDSIIKVLKKLDI